MKNNLLGKTFLSCCFYLYRFRKYVSYGFPIINFCNPGVRRSQWPRGLRRRSAATRLLRLWVRIPPGAWMSVCCECCVSSGRGLCDGLITRPEESYRLWCVVVCDLETSKMGSPWPALGRSATGGKNPGVHYETPCITKNNIPLLLNRCHLNDKA